MRDRKSPFNTFLRFAPIPPVGETMTSLFLVAVTVILSRFLYVICNGSQVFFLLDVLHEHYSYQKMTCFFLGESTASVPLWSALESCGVPFLADPQAQVFYPGAILYRCGHFAQAFGCNVVLHLAISLSGVYSLVRVMSMSRRAAIFASVAYGLGGQTFCIAATPTSLFAHSWLPWIARMAAKSRIQSSLGGWDTMLLGLLLLVTFLSGQPQFLLYGVVVYLVFSWNTWGSMLRAAWALIVGGLVVLLCGAVLLIPAMFWVLQTTRAHGLSWDLLQADSLGLQNLITLVFPFRSLAPNNPSYYTIRSLWPHFAFVGTFSLALAVMRLRHVFRDPSKVIGAGPVIMGLLLGWNPRWNGRVPLFGFPPFNYFSHSGLWVFMIELGIVLLCAGEISDSREHGSGKRRTAAASSTDCLLSSLVALGGVICIAVDWVGNYTNSVQAYCSIAGWVLAGGWIVASYMGLLHREGLWRVATAVTVLELLTVAHRLQPTIPGSLMETRTPIEVRLEKIGRTEACPVRILSLPNTTNGHLRTYDSLASAFLGMKAQLRPHLIAALGLWEVGNRNPLVWCRAFSGLGEIGGATPSELRPLLRKCAVGYVVDGSRRLCDHSGFVKMWAGDEGDLVKVDNASRVVEIVPASSGYLNFSRWQSGKWDVSATVWRSSRIVIREQNIPGWRAWEDGRRIVLESDKDILTIPLASGRHRVQLEYAPVYFPLAAWVSSLSLTTVIVYSMIL